MARVKWPCPLYALAKRALVHFLEKATDNEVEGHIRSYKVILLKFTVFSRLILLHENVTCFWFLSMACTEQSFVGEAFYYFIWETSGVDYISIEAGLRRVL